jgi:competence protein ComEC
MLASLTAQSFQLWLSLAVLSFALWLLLNSKNFKSNRFSRLSSLTFAVLALWILFLGAARYQSAQRQITESFLAHYNDEDDWIEITGLLIEPPLDRDSYIELRVRAEQLQLPNSSEFPIEGMVLARTSIDKDWRYGDRLILRGKLETAPEFEDFSYREYLARQGIDSLLSFAQVTRLESAQGNNLLSAIYSFRNYALQNLRQLYPDPEASLLAGILLGDESGLSEELKEDFNETGARHVIAISGFNITILAGLSISLFKKAFGVRRAAWVTLGIIVSYTILVGADASVTRAAVMGSLALFARQVGRRQLALNTLAFTAALMAIFKPTILWDVGFQLSFAATLGLVLYADPLTKWTNRLLSKRFSGEWAKKATGPIAEYFLLTIAAQITTLPLLLFYFQRFSLLSLPTNILILPVQPAVMILGGLSVLVSMIWMPLGQIVALSAWPFLAFTIRIVELFALPAWSSMALAPISAAIVIVYYLVLLVLTLRPVQIEAKKLRLQPSAILISTVLICLWVWSAVLAAPRGYLQITLLDVGDGEALLVRTPEGRNLLINGGESERQLSEGLGRALPFLDRRLDWLIVAGVEEEHIGGLPGSLERLAPDAIAWSGLPFASYESRLLRAEGLDLDMAFSNLRARQSFDLGAKAKIDVIDITEQGAILLIHMQGFRMLVPIGIDSETIRALDWGKEIGRVDAVLLADQGSLELNPLDWLENLNPNLILLSADALSSASFPVEEISKFLEDRTLLRTDRDGWIRLTTDGDQLWVEVESD